jgi:hypothetical protein
MDLETFRLSKHLSYWKLGALIGLSHPGQTRSWALGETWPDANKLQRIIDATEGEVTLEGMHRRRLSYLSEMSGESVHNNPVELMSG